MTISCRGAVTSCVTASRDSLSEVEERHGDPAQSLDAAALLPLLLGSSGGRQRAGVQRHRQLRLSGQLVDLHRETHPAHTERRGRRGGRAGLKLELTTRVQSILVLLPPDCRAEGLGRCVQVKL